ncbi:MAG: TetR/AcrR family transcriptional regulator [Candidatus Cloacimonetes bacterium]|nr:TetR/AcrR family transcriptional regulator [Candidatus Cloacimonadota bacterium]MCF7813197.1 TetR/AcrR family transcriptional regulator [Candidatus Cloacimonadota bacterium]MCF7867645.1 TetR/AcrR family transcriptional regulator [Candidatus Cloacimonadota bacterium]MCF7883080.1 TetR/AcrR family transcriptional regulator [Candidatus Cloacimonadota bacterium]
MKKTKTVIVKTALKLFLQKGFYNVSMNMIADEIGISKPAIYHHFRNKDAMVEGVLDYFTERMAEWSNDYYSNLSSGRDFIERMFKAIPIYKDVETVLLDESVESYPYSYNDLLMILSKYKPELRERIAQDQTRARNRLKEYISQAQNENLIRTDLQPSRLATMIHTIIEGSAFICELDPKLKVQRVTNEVYEIVKKLIMK